MSSSNQTLVAPSLQTRNWEDLLYPECNSSKFEYKDRLAPHVQTITSLGLKRTRQAEAAGWICIREARPRTSPARWVSPSVLPLLEEIAAEIADKRAKTESRRAVRSIQIQDRDVLKGDASAPRRAQKQETIKEILSNNNKAIRERVSTVLAARKWLSEEDRLSALQWTLANARKHTVGEIERHLFWTHAPTWLRQEGLTIRSLQDQNQIQVLFAPFQVELMLGANEDPVFREISLAPFVIREEKFGHSFLRSPGDFAREIKKLATQAAERAEQAARADWETTALLVRTLAAEHPNRDKFLAKMREHALSPQTHPRTWRQTVDAQMNKILWPRRQREFRALLGPQWSLEPASKKTGKTRARYREPLGVECRAPIAFPRCIEVTGDAGLLSNWLLKDENTRANLAESCRAITAKVPIARETWGKLAIEIGDEWERRLATGLYPEDQLKALFASVWAQDTTNKKGDFPQRLRIAMEPFDRQMRMRSAVHRVLAERGMSSYKDLFPQARSLTRKMILYVGPTNSGKTFQALNKLAEGNSGVYLAPLRLLALEGQQEMEKRGVSCSFLTGEERHLVENASFLASTIEMLNLERVVDAAVIDEVQLLQDSSRGWAWTQAVVGAPARTLILTGSPESLPLVEALASYLEEPLEIHLTERFTPLRPQRAPTRWDDIEPGTAVIAFSRREVLGIKEILERRYRVSVIYGNLTPQVRREEARRFREGETDVLVATDAIAMGLNLPIRTVLFYATEKWNGTEECDLSRSEILQIAGRAGRFGLHEEGWVGATEIRSLRAVKQAIEAGPIKVPSTSHVPVRPSWRHLEAFASELGSSKLVHLLNVFHQHVTFDSPLLCSNITLDMKKLAAESDRHPTISLRDRFAFACAPVDLRSDKVMERFRQWLRSFQRGDRVSLPSVPSSYRSSQASSDEEMLAAETLAKELTLYAWLAFRYPDVFTKEESCAKARNTVDGFIERSLASHKQVRRQCSECGGGLPPLHRHRICDSCYRGRRPWWHDEDNDW